MNVVRTLELTTLMVIDTDCIGSCKSNYHTITTTMAPKVFEGGWVAYGVEHHFQ